MANTTKPQDLDILKLLVQHNSNFFEEDTIKYIGEKRKQKTIKKTKKQQQQTNIYIIKSWNN